MANFPSITHVAVTVTDLERSTRWYSELLGAGPVLDEDEQTGGFHHTVFALDGGQLGTHRPDIHRAQQPRQAGLAAMTVAPDLGDDHGVAAQLHAMLPPRHSRTGSAGSATAG